MALAQHYMLKEKVAKSVTKEIVLDIQLDNIEKVFHLPFIHQYQKITYNLAKKWYR